MTTSYRIKTVNNENEKDNNKFDQFNNKPPKIKRSSPPPPTLTMASFSSWDDSVEENSGNLGNTNLCASSKSHSRNNSVVTFEDSFNASSTFEDSLDFHASTTFSPDRASPSRSRFYSLDSSPALKSHKSTIAPPPPPPLELEEHYHIKSAAASGPPPRPPKNSTDLKRNKSSKLFHTSLHLMKASAGAPLRSRAHSSDSVTLCTSASTSTRRTNTNTTTTLPSCLRVPHSHSHPRPHRTRANSSDPSTTKRSSDSAARTSTRKGSFTIFSDAAATVVPKKSSKTRSTSSLNSKAKDDRTVLTDMSNSTRTTCSTSKSKWSSLRKDVLTQPHPQPQSVALAVTRKPRLTMKTVMNASTFISGAAKAAAAVVSPDRDRPSHSTGTGTTSSKFSAVEPHSHSRPPLSRSGDSSVCSAGVSVGSRPPPPPPPFGLKRSATSKLTLSLKSSRRMMISSPPGRTQAKLLEDLKMQKNDIIKQEREAMDLMKSAIETTRLNFKDMAKSVAHFMQNMTSRQIAVLSFVLYFVTGYTKFLHTVPLLIVVRVVMVILRWLKFVKSNRISELKNLQRDSVSLRLFASKSSSNKNKDIPLEKRIQKKLIGMAVARSMICKEQ